MNPAIPPDEDLPPAPFQVKAQVRVPGGGMSISDSAEALFKIIAPKLKLFHRGGVVVEVAQEGDLASLKILDAVALQSRFEKYVQFMKLNKIKDGGFQMEPTVISEATARQYMASEACANNLPKISGLLRCPLLVQRDGRAHLVQNGYDAATGFFVQTDKIVEPCTVAEARNLLAGVLQDFDFATASDKSRALASFITPTLKFGGWIAGPVPIDVAEANASQSGKTYRQKLNAAIHNQPMAVVTKLGGGVGSHEETLQKHLIQGCPFIQLDNVRGKLDSQFLEGLLTASGPVSARIPFQPPINIDPAKHIICISSNGFETTKDLANRCSIIRIRKRENYEFRQHQGMDMLAFCFAHHPVLLGAIFALVEAWAAAGKPRTSEIRHDFREWAQVNDWIVQRLLGQAPLMDGHTELKARAANPDLTFVRQLGLLVEAEAHLGHPLSASQLTTICQNGNLDIPRVGKEEQFDEDKGRKIIGRLMGNLFGEEQQLDSDEYRITREKLRRDTPNGHWQEVNCYTFVRPDVVIPPLQLVTLPPAPPCEG